MQLLLSGSALERLSALIAGLSDAAQDSSVAELLSRRSQPNLQEVFPQLVCHTSFMQRHGLQSLPTAGSWRRMPCRRREAKHQTPILRGQTLELTPCIP